MNERESLIEAHNAERDMAFKRIDEQFDTLRRRRKEKLKWFRENPSPLTAVERLRNLKRALWH